MDIDSMHDITGADLAEVVKAAYDLSHPQGLGFIHFEEGPLSDEEAKSFVADDGRDGIVVSLDYVKGRACKFSVYKCGDKLLIRKDWYDHSPSDLNKLLERVRK